MITTQYIEFCQVVDSKDARCACGIWTLLAMAFIGGFRDDPNHVITALFHRGLYQKIWSFYPICW